MDEPQGCIDAVFDDGRVLPLTITTHTIIEQNKLADNIRVNIKRDIPRFTSRPDLSQVRDEPLAIVCAGPTLKKTIEHVRGFRNILVCGSGHDNLIRHGITPTYALVSDGGKEDKGNLFMPQKETTFIIASQCDPSLFEHLKDHKVEMWHYHGQAAPNDEEQAVLLNNEQAICWGSTVTINSIQIALLLGFQYLHFFGFDSCYGESGEHHCCEIAGSLEYNKHEAKVGNRTFVSDMGLMIQAEQFFKYMEIMGAYFHSTIYGDGMIAAMCAQGDPGLMEYVSLA